MSIERSGMTVGPKATTGAESHGGKGKVKQNENANPLAGGGFLALLASLESEAVSIVGDAGTTSQTGAADTQPLSAETTQMGVLLPAMDTSALVTQNLSNDPAIVLPENLPNDLAMLLAQAGQIAGDQSADIGTGTERPESVRGGIKLSAFAPVKPELALVAPAPPGSKMPGDFSQKVDALLEQTAQAALTPRAKGAGFQSGADAILAESRALKLSALVDVAANESALSGALLTSGIGDNYLRQADRTIGKLSTLPSGSGVDGSWGHQALVAGNRVDAPSAMADPAMQSLESMVAETVSYWVAQGVQNAELTLDGWGGEPIEVSISLKGDEAHIGFRTDQPEIRQILEGAVTQLKDLLTTEGLVLSGVSVGTSGQDGAGAQEQRHRPGTHQATVTMAETVPTEILRPVNQLAGTTVDLFV